MNNFNLSIVILQSSLKGDLSAVVIFIDMFLIFLSF